MDIRPQPGPQELFLSAPEDIVIYGGSRGGGKTHGLLLDPIRFTDNPKFRATIFRRTIPQIKMQGGLWEAAHEVYAVAGAAGFSQSLEWRFRSGARVRFAHMEREADRYDWQGAQIPWIGFDQLEHFTSAQFWFMLACNRSMADVPTYIRGTCNPDPDSFLREFLSWWIDADTGYAIPERSGVGRWFARVNEEMIWGNTKEEVVKRCGPESEPKSVSFIRATVFDNPILLSRNPQYVANLKALPMIDRLQQFGDDGTKGGNWNVRPCAGIYFRREWFEIVNAAPVNVEARVRFWDRAATPKTNDNDPDATVGVRMSRGRDGFYYIEDRVKLYESAHRVEAAMKNIGHQDGVETTVRYKQDPGSAGKGEAQQAARALTGLNVGYEPTSGSKAVRAKPLSAQCEAGNVKIVRASWNAEYLTSLENFTGTEVEHDDDADATTGAFEYLTQPTGAIRSGTDLYTGEANLRRYDVRSLIGRKM